MKKRVSIILLAFAILTATAVLAADGDERFLGGNYDGYAQNSVLDVPITIPAGMIIRIF